MSLFTIDRSQLKIVRHWITLITSIIYFVYMWYITPHEEWIIERKYPVTTVEGDPVINPLTHKQKIFYANRWTEYNILRGSSLAFLLASITGVAVDLLDYHDVIIHVNENK